MTNKNRISEQMKKIKSKDTKPELALRKELWKAGYRYRKNVASIPGKPDIVFKSAKIAIFIDGEFWHGYDWEKQKKRIHNHSEYWIKKIEKNMKHDKKVNLLLKSEGWLVLRYPAKYVLNHTEECATEIIQILANVTTST